PEARPGEPREVPARGVPGCTEAGDEERRRSARLPHRLRVRRRVVRDRRRGSDPDEDAEPEEQPHRELLRTLDRKVEADQEREARDVRDEAPSVGQIAPEVGAEREQARGDRDESHRLAEERAGLVAYENGLGLCLVRAHAVGTPAGSGIFTAEGLRMYRKPLITAIRAPRTSR